jgi:peptide/nickel transport system substrate-binding protein/oligopeptide transport system substrate-binding protein
MSRSRVPKWLAAAMAGALALGACTPAATTQPSSAAASGGASSASASASTATTTGGTVSVAFNSDIQYFDPAKGYDVVSWPAERLIYETLLQYNSGTKLIPLLADGMPTISSDGKTITFKLHSGVKFVNPDGSVLRDMTADDVVDSINRVLDPNLKPSASPVAGAFFGNIAGAADVIAGKAKAASGIKKVDDTTVEFTLNQADATFLNVLATPFASIVPKDTPRDAAVVAQKPVGTGPYLLKSYSKGSQATFVANKSYWQQGQPYLDEIDFKVGVDDNAAIQQIQAGQLDILGDPIPSGSFTQITTDPQYKDQVKDLTMVANSYLFMDTQQPNNGPLSKPAVRQAIEWAIDKDNVIKILHGAGTRADCIFPPDMPGYDTNCKPYGFDQAKAKQMLAAAGYPNGFESTLYTDTTDPDPQIAQSLQQDLAAIGIKVNIVTEEFATFLDRIETPHKAPLGYVGWFQDYPDPSDFIDPILSCATAVQGGANAALYCNKDVDSMAAAAKGETDSAKRIQAYKDIQAKIMADAPWVPIFHQKWVTMVSKRVTSFRLHPVWNYDLRTVKLNPGS